jgi:hypothetical protein
MKRFRRAVVIGVMATVFLIASFSFYLVSQSRSEFSKKKYYSIVRVRTESRGYKEKLDEFAKRWNTLGELSQEKGANVSYDIVLHPAGFDELNEKVVSTYAHGFFFLKSAVLEGTPEGVRLAVSGFKRGEAQQVETQKEETQQ